MRHHYIPCFYTKRWAGTDNRLSEYSRPHTIVKSKRIAPAGTGYVDDLYAIPRTSTDRKHMLETRFMGNIDQRASDALRKIEGGNIGSLTQAERIYWATFLISLMHRGPDKIVELGPKVTSVFQKVLAELRDDYKNRRTNDDPETFDEFMRIATEAGYFERARILLLQSTILLPETANLISAFHWGVCSFSSESHKLLTSDKPVLMSKGLRGSDAYIAVPIGPRSLFLATRTVKIRQTILADARLAETSNDSIVRQAIQFVYGTDGSQLVFVERRLPRKGASLSG